jgi:hypothetical protein
VSCAGDAGRPSASRQPDSIDCAAIAASLQHGEAGYTGATSAAKNHSDGDTSSTGSASSDEDSDSHGYQSDGVVDFAAELRSFERGRTSRQGCASSQGQHTDNGSEQVVSFRQRTDDGSVQPASLGDWREQREQCVPADMAQASGREPLRQELRGVALGDAIAADRAAAVGPPRALAARNGRRSAAGSHAPHSRGAGAENVCPDGGGSGAQLAAPMRNRAGALVC